MAYTKTRTKQKDPPLADGRVRLVFTFLGDAGEPDVDRERYIDGSTTQAELDRWRYNEARGLATRKTLADSLTLNQELAINAPEAPELTPKQAWDALARRVREGEALKLTDSKAVSDLDALRQRLNSDYRTGYL